MKRILLLSSIILVTTGLFAQRTIWTFGTARNVPKNQAEFGIVHPLQIGLTETLEVSVSPLLGLSFAPNISLKNRWYTGANYFFASQHTFSTPTLLTRFAGELATNNLLFSNNESFKSLVGIDSLPYQYFFKNQGLFTFRVGTETLLTGRVGASFGFKGKGDSLPVFDQQLFYPWSATLNKKFIWSLGAQIDGNIVRKHNYSASVDFNSIGIGIDQLALVHKGYYIYNHSIKFAALVGYRMMYATYLNPEMNPADPDYQNIRRFNIMPMVDLIWKINAKAEPTKDLFRR